MKRRDFIKNSTFVMAGSGNLCLQSSAKSKKIKTKKFKNIQVPMLGLGCMRFPMKGSEVDLYEVEKMVDYCMEHGANYFDTAYMYVNSMSESIIGKILKRYKRSDFFLADKNPVWIINQKSDFRKYFEEQLKRCQVDYFDFYMCHNMNEGTIHNFDTFSVYDELLKLKEEGKIKYCGFSYHGKTALLERLLKEYTWDFCQLQINYMDWDVVKSREQYAIAEETNTPVVVMEPLRGGYLVNLDKESAQLLKDKYPDTTPAEFGLRWAASREKTLTVLSGMSNLEQVKQNIETFTNFQKVTPEEEKIAEIIAKHLQSKGEIRCTACKYCLDVCPKGINIPAIFSLYNQYTINKQEKMLKMFYLSLNDSEMAHNCINCNLCSKICPQALNIPELLAKINEETFRIKI